MDKGIKVLKLERHQFTYKITCVKFCSAIAKSYYVPIFLKFSIGAAKIIHNELFKDNDGSVKM